jgi:hypothetical protein
MIFTGTYLFFRNKKKNGSKSDYWNCCKNNVLLQIYQQSLGFSEMGPTLAWAIPLFALQHATSTQTNQTEVCGRLVI